jgi:hypothetical protein
MEMNFESWTRVIVETRDDKRQNYELYIVLEDNEDCMEQLKETVRDNRLRPVFNTEMIFDEKNDVLCEAIYIRISKEKAGASKDDGKSIMDIVEEWTTVTFVEKKSEPKEE